MTSFSNQFFHRKETQLISAIRKLRPDLLKEYEGKVDHDQIEENMPEKNKKGNFFNFQIK